MPNFGYHLARWQGRFVRAVYRLCLPLIVRRAVVAPRQLELEVFSYSNEAMFPEQIASLRSFVRHVGRPSSYTIVSDGTHSERSLSLLRRADRSVVVRHGSPMAENASGKLKRYLTDYPMGRQLAVIMALPEKKTALYVDSDVLFFRGAADLLSYLNHKEKPAFYLRDCEFAGDDRLLRSEAEKNPPVNSGFLMVFHPLDWSKGVERFLELQEEPNFFTNQTIVHIAMLENDARSFDPAKYVLQLDDQFIFPDRYASAAIALRHYVNPVRHKFWTSLNK